VPLIHVITNYVVMNDNANALLSFGASPAMAMLQEEAYDFTAISNAMYINIKYLLSLTREDVQL